MTIRRYQRILQDVLKLSDSRWEYAVEDLPDPGVCNDAGYVKSCSLNANGSTQNITLTFTKVMSNRAICQKSLSNFVHVTCSDFRMQAENGKPTTFRESSGYIARFLKHGLVLNGVRYSFYGHSNSQLKSRSCFLMAGTQVEVDQAVERLGDFSKMKTVAKKVKRIGLLFSTAHAVVLVNPDRCEDIEDIARDDYIFTDGCGNIGRGLARLLSQKKPIAFRNKRYHPSVFQIRYRGYKGIVILKPELRPPIWLQLRQSMRKFSGGDDHNFAVVEHSKPYTYGYLNDEIVLLLHALGIAVEVFEQRQTEHFQFLDSVCISPQNGFRFLMSLNYLDLAEKCLLNGIETVKGPLQKLVAQEKSKMLNKRGEYRCRILIPKSRLLFGVCDQYGILKSGQCYISPTSDSDGISYALTGLQVLVVRNPCLHPGDLRKLEAVDEPRLSHLVDCIVFSTNGKRPAADMMSGGDLDGDTFFVCWDSILIPSEISQPAEYPGGKESIQFSKITSQERIEYFSRSTSMQLGQVKNLFLRWARLKGALSPECQELNRLFSQCVDANRIKIPPRLEKLPDMHQEPFVLDVLHQSAEKHVNANSTPTLLHHANSEENLIDLLTYPHTVSQFELAQITLRWCQLHRKQFEDYWHYFDPSLLSTEERLWFASFLPAKHEIIEPIVNDLVSSSILTPVELGSVGLRNAHVKWRRVFDSTSDRLANLLEVFEKIFPFFHKKLLVLRINNRLSVAMYVPKTVEAMDDFLLAQGGRLFAFPHTKEVGITARVIVPTKHNACFYFDRNKFELFEGERRNTFIFFTRAANDESKYRNIQNRGDRARARQETMDEGENFEWRTSIALNKFSQNLVRHIGRLNREGIGGAELYVVSNTDTRSLRNIDLWLEQIDTVKVHQNFIHEESLPKEAATLSGIDWEKETARVVQIARAQNFDAIERTSAEDIAKVLQLAWFNNSPELVSKVSFRLLDFARTAHGSAVNLDAVSKIVDFLVFMPTLVIHFIRLCPWTGIPDIVRDCLLGLGLEFVHALILCANKMQHMVTSSLSTVLSQLENLSIFEVQKICEAVALTMDTTETALDILLGSVDPLATGLMTISPKNSQYLVKQLTAITINHIEEGVSNKVVSKLGGYEWRFQYPLQFKEGAMILKCDYRIDAPKTIRLATGDHVRFTCHKPPTSIVWTELASFEALVERSDVGQVIFLCMRHPPPWYQLCPWTLQNWGSFTTAQTMIDAVVKLISEKETCCEIYQSLLPSHPYRQCDRRQEGPRSDLSSLNDSQQNAVIKAITGPVTCIWGPPGTGKTHTIISIIREVLLQDPKARLLVTAPTHNAVDHVMRQYLKYTSDQDWTKSVHALRVSTDIHKVASDIRAYTCDAMLGKDINQFPAARKKALGQITRSRMIFTTCIGAGLGLLRHEQFGNVIIDEASQLTEPASLVPLVKGAFRAILVGDHVQLRATVQPNAQALDFDVSLFERIWTSSPDNTAIQRAMLTTQYRMHPQLCAFPSQEFYDSRLSTASHCATITLPPSSFPWPAAHRAVFIQSSSPEDLGRRSKSNTGQVKLATHIIHLLRLSGPFSSSSLTLPSRSPTKPCTVAILTPYTAQATLLKQSLPDETTSSIDGFQGQEADIIVFVTVRSNLKREIGFLRDMRRLNVAITRAKAGLIVIGDEETLSGAGSGDVNMDAHTEDEEAQNDKEACYETWKRLVKGMHKVKLEFEVGLDSRPDEVKPASGMKKGKGRK